MDVPSRDGLAGQYFGDGLAGRYFWAGHANPRSVWAAVVAFPTLVLALYRRDGSLLAGALLVVATVTVLSPPPEDDEAWATRVVLGERVWMERGALMSWDGLFTVLSAPVYLYTIRAAVRRQPVRTVCGTVAAMALMVVFFRRMVVIYEKQANRTKRME